MLSWNHWQKIIPTLILAPVLSGNLTAAEPPVLKPQYIYYEKGTPPSVKEAAEEIRKYIEEIYGAKLEIVNTPRKESMICLGDNPVAAEAGLHGKNFPYESGCIMTRNGNVMIVGHDVPNDGRLPTGGWSLGTYNMSLTFIEKILGVRFLMPGKHGTYVPPKKEKFVLPELHITDTPAFQHRQLIFAGDKDWYRHHRFNYHHCGGSLLFGYNHSWQDLFPAKGARAADRYGDRESLYEKHPEYFRLFGGERERPQSAGGFFLCLTNPGVIDEMVRRVGVFYDLQKTNYCSISPNDGSRWCECEKCSRFYDKDNPYFPGRASKTRAVLNYYNTVAKQVKTKFPGKYVAGYIYADYALPPVEPVKLEDNIYLAWAPVFAYGPWRFDPETDQLWNRLVKDWNQCTDKMIYYGVDFWLRQYAGIPMPVCRKILKNTFPTLNKKWVGTYIYGLEGWGQSALLNYMLARMQWNAGLDVDKEISEFCRLAYGEGGKYIEQMYNIVDEAFEKCASDKRIQRSHNFSVELLENVYAANWSRISRCFEQAWALAATPGEKWRLEQLRKNLRIANYHLEALGFIDSKPGNILHLESAGFTELTNSNDKFVTSVPPHPHLKSVFKRIEARLLPEPSAGPKSPSAIPYALFLHQDVLLMADKDGKAVIEIKPVLGEKIKEFPYYALYDESYRLLESGLLKKQRLEFEVREGKHYYFLYMPIGLFNRYTIDCNIPWALGDGIDPHGVRFRSKLPESLSFYVPQDIRTFSIFLTAETRQDKVSGTVLSPDDRVVSEFKNVSLKELNITVPDGTPAGFWKIRFADTKLAVEFLVKGGKNLSGFFFPNDGPRFIVTKK